MVKLGRAPGRPEGNALGLAISSDKGASALDVGLDVWRDNFTSSVERRSFGAVIQRPEMAHKALAQAVIEGRLAFPASVKMPKWGVIGSCFGPAPTEQGTGVQDACRRMLRVPIEEGPSEASALPEFVTKDLLYASIMWMDFQRSSVDASCPRKEWGTAA